MDVYYETDNEIYGEELQNEEEYVRIQGERGVQGEVESVLVRDNVQGKFQCPGHVLDIVPDMSCPSVPSKYPIIFCYNKGFKLAYLGQY